MERRATVGGPPWQLPVGVLAVAAAGQVAGLLALAVAAPDLAAHRWYGGAQLASAHLLGLGFLTLAILGALMQLVPVLLRRVLGPPVWTGAAAGTVGLGAWVMAAGLWTGANGAIAAGGSMVMLGLGAVLVIMVRVLVGARRDGTLGLPGAGLALATGWLAVVVVLGAMLVDNRVRPVAGFAHTQLLTAHTTVALAGWVGGTILAMALRLAPMFALSHGYRTAPGTAAVAVWHTAVALLALGFGTGVTPITVLGGVVMLVACGPAGWFVLGVARTRRRRPEAPLLHLVAGVAATALACVVGLAGWATGADPSRTLIPAALLAFIALGCGVTSGHMFKVVPMLVWTGRHAHQAGTPGAPRLSDLTPTTLALAEQALFATGLVTLMAGVAGGSGVLARVGALTLTAAAVCVLAAVGACVGGHGVSRHAPVDAHHEPAPQPTNGAIA